jgi:hypothetical protein
VQEELELLIPNISPHGQVSALTTFIRHRETRLNLMNRDLYWRISGHGSLELDIIRLFRTEEDDAPRSALIHGGVPRTDARPALERLDGSSTLHCEYGLYVHEISAHGHRVWPLG